jgi:four helix bundle protein
MPEVRGYQDLEVWQRSMALVVRCYQLANRLPQSEAFGLSLQIRRSAVSVPSNIAEGHGRSGTGEFLHHLSIAHGSLMELETQLEISQRLNYMSKAEAEEPLRDAAEIGRMLHGLIRALRERAPRQIRRKSES